jgi:hypothetical protein
MATLFPELAMRVRRVAEPLSVVLKEENVSLCISSLVSMLINFGRGRGRGMHMQYMCEGEGGC